MPPSKKRDDEDISVASSEDNLKNLEWTPNVEALLAQWSDEALSYAWLHLKSEKKYRKLNYSFTIPIVVLSTLTGSINLAMSSMIPADYNHIGNLVTGGMSIFTGILGTLLNFFKYAQISESHRNAALQWHKFYRLVKTELALQRSCRKAAPTFYATAKLDMDRLLESSPNIPSEIVQKFEELSRRDVDLPDIIGPLRRTNVYQDISFDQLDQFDDFRPLTSLRKNPTFRTKTFEKNAKNEDLVNVRDDVNVNDVNVNVDAHQEHDEKEENGDE